MFGRLLKEESGVAMGLAIITVVLVGVMGAGLLTFVMTDLNTVVEVNQGHKAFEMADAGIKAAESHLKVLANQDTELYDGTENGGNPESQWSYSKGMTVKYPDLPDDSANVTIEYDTSGQYYEAISTGSVGESRRKIEARFAATSGAGGGGGNGVPAYYTPGDIKIKPNTSFKGVSLFSGRNIRFENLAANTVTAFRNDYNNSGGLFDITGTASDKDRLGDWNRPNWNNVGRTRGGSSFENVGFAAEGKMCGSSSCSSPDPSVADGVYGYDSTTGSRGNFLKFAKKINCATGSEEPERNLGGANGNGTSCTPPTPARDLITYPFDRTPPDAERLRQLAQTQSDGSKYYKGTSVPWGSLYPNAKDDRVVFIDAEGSTIGFDSSNEANNKGILVVWCGQLNMNKKFQGIIITLYGNDLPGGSSCGPDKGVYRSVGQDITGYTVPGY